MAIGIELVRAVALTLLFSGGVLADAPPEPPAPAEALQRHCSLNGRWCVELRARPVSPDGTVTVRVLAQGSAGSGTSNWSAPMRIIGVPAVTNDGHCVVDLATVSNLLPPEATSGQPAFGFHCKGRPDTVLRLDQLISNFEKLPRTTSHRVWAESFGLDSRDRLVVRTAEGRDFIIDPRSGKPIRGAFVH